MTTKGLIPIQCALVMVSIGAVCLPVLFGALAYDFQTNSHLWREAAIYAVLLFAALLVVLVAVWCFLSSCFTVGNWVIHHAKKQR